ncbi:glucosamine--fructose-6-phosphate aminotransferase (isomerizing) [Mycolicibacterium mucogenicum 261Sha1.1M5]|uniref:Glutamine--fructose-6-phosphate aminotransferase [isomerizing] n=1 Tax=Leucobacter aridicollis TaxID=283878 RepID=A0A852RD01_9MICO|nr:glutamine--fructose-6-phosphate transaminase (isomerizing) [Leucobacter aridicollis]MBL3682765.1 glutamine--fructose-6-phosphate transaminase (isomerizing) [Leucobacter aridicollis]MCS3426907.1 glucosamine--fructose-6-phosphate aminotransferase (isomerizing) [Leucobacter aridicollis]NYD26204.1 glucosamine--fructose-6-phosphate aminotransferase (isomerizing) [Leucobacter aridicollis]RKQ85408.1 glucosamine--fructose-6-phosphate aminotransferase (isomerizing) [Mycolicibacterium mucogenicum 261S
MCGIVGYAGPNETIEALLNGLRRLEYRGYDSAGVAVIDDTGGISVRKKSGKLVNLEDLLEASPLQAAGTGIGHTRWATHGGPTDVNAHPHLGDDGRLALIHNGIVENFAELRDEVVSRGAELASETDTEVVAALLGLETGSGKDLETAFRDVVQRLHGTFTLLAMHQSEPGKIVAARHHSPLVVGLGDGENFLGSDVAAFVSSTRRAVVVEEDNIAVITPESVRITDFAGAEVEFEEYEVEWDAGAADKGGWSSFMAKEINEQPEAIENTIRGRIVDGHVEIPELTALGEDRLQNVDRIIIVACGTASYAGLVGSYAIEQWARIPVEVQLSHEFRYRDPVLTERTMVISVSQSGETMDTLMAVKYAIERGVTTVSVCNTQSATIPRESDAAVYTHAGPEVAVASTKAFVAQITALYLLGLHLGRVRGTLSAADEAAAIAQFETLPEKMAEAVATHDQIAELAHWMADTRSVLFLGRHAGYPAALEGALKLKEIAYIHAEGFAAGELKHGPIALIDHGQPVFVLVPSPRTSPLMHSKVVSNIQEIRARGARVIAIVEKGDTAVLPFADEVVRIPLTDALFDPILQVVPLQWFALELSTAKGLDVDQPRNLAKSVTVE